MEFNSLLPSLHVLNTSDVSFYSKSSNHTSWVSRVHLSERYDCFSLCIFQIHIEKKQTHTFCSGCCCSSLYLCTCAHAHTWTNAHMCRPVMDVCQVCSSVTSHFSEQGFSLNLELMNLAGFSQQAAGIFQFLPPQPWECNGTQLCLAFYIGIGDLNPGPHACVTSTLLTEPSPESLWLFFLLMMFWERKFKVWIKSDL